MNAPADPILVSWKAELLAAAVRQGPSFVVLMLVLTGLWQGGRYVVAVGVPAHLDQIKQGYREIQEAHGKDLGRVIAAFEAEHARTRNIVDVLERLVENKDLLGEIVKELRAQRSAPRDKT